MIIGDFKFDSIGTQYPANIPVVALRLVPAISGALLPPLAYHTVLELGLSQWTGALAGFLLLCGALRSQWVALLLKCSFVLPEFDLDCRQCSSYTIKIHFDGANASSIFTSGLTLCFKI